MPDEVVKFLNHFNLGNALSLLITCSTCLISAYIFFKKEIKKIKGMGSQETLEEIQDENAEKKLDGVENDLHKLKEYVKKKSDFFEEFSDFEKSLEECNKEIESINKQLVLIEKNVKLLFDSCITLNRVLITIQRNKFINVDKIIDMNSLRDIEDLYARYLDEVKDGGDEYIAKMIRELRDIPVKEWGSYMLPHSSIYFL